MRINHNIGALNTYRQLTSNSEATSKSIEKLSSGLRINRAGDDAAGLAISEKMRGQIRGLDMAAKNSQDAISMIQTAEGALNETHSILQRMRELAVQSANDTNTDTDRGEIQKEINELTSEINRIGNTTEFNTKKLLNGELANTFTSTVKGMNFVGGTDKATNVGSTGLDVTLLSGEKALKAGEHTLEITVERNTRADQTVNATFSDLEGTGAGKGVVFKDAKIDAGATAVADDWTLTYNATDKEFTLTNATNTVTDKIKVGEAYNNHGLSFQIDNVGTLATGDTLEFTTAGGVESFGTTQVGFVSAATAGADKNPNGVTLTLKDEKEASVAAGGKVTVEWTADGEITVSITDKANKVLSQDKVDGTTAYNNHGLNINFNELATADHVGAKIEFTIAADTYTVKAKLDNKAATTLTSTYDGTSTNAVANFTGIEGLKLDSSAKLENGTHTFNVEQTVEEDGDDFSATFQIGANENQSMSLGFSDMRANALGITGTGTGFSTSNNVTDGTNNVSVERALDVTTAKNAANAITKINDAIEKVSAERSKLGASQNRLEHTINNLGTAAENLTAAESRIRDVDMAKEMMNQTKNNILSQAAQAMLAQANQQPQGVLQLLRG